MTHEALSLSWDRVLPQGLLSACFWPELGHLQLQESLGNQRLLVGWIATLSKFRILLLLKDRGWLLDRHVPSSLYYFSSLNPNELQI